MQKARRHGIAPLRPLVGTRFQGLFHSFIQGSFHLSLTVLVRYRSQESVQPWRVVPPASDRVSRARPYSGCATVGRRVSRTGLSPAAAGPSMPFRYLTPL